MEMCCLRWGVLHTPPHLLRFWSCPRLIRCPKVPKVHTHTTLHLHAKAGYKVYEFNYRTALVQERVGE